MNVMEWFKNKVLKLLGLIKTSNPNSERLTYINDDESIRLSKIQANKTWFLSDGDELLNWYTNQQTYGFAKNPIYNRNKRQFFWSMSINEGVKRVHSGVPRAIIDTLSTAIVGVPRITSKVNNDLLLDILDCNNFEFMLAQQIRPLALVEGDGAIKINIAKGLSDKPLIEYYESADWEPVYKSNKLLGMLFKSYYKNKNKNYVLYESRLLTNDGLRIEFKLYRLGKNNELMDCDKEEIPELKGLEDSLIEGFDELLAVPVKYYFDPLHKDRGKSIYDGKLDLFDMMDEILTQASQTNRVSTPVEYYPVDLLERTKNGQMILPKLYNRQYVKIEGTMDGDGNVNNTIQTTQPQLNFEQYGRIYNDTLTVALTGVLSPASLGIDVAKKDNADAQREKEKQTIFTRNLIINAETPVIKKLCNMLMMAKNYIDTGMMQSLDYEISVKYDEFANPSFESELQILGPAWSSGQISTERYVSLLWAGKLSEEEMIKELEWLDNNKQQDDFDMSQLMEHENEVKDRADLRREGQEQEESDEFKE